MPVATPFAALGRGNGFPFCPAKVNVLNNSFDNTEYYSWSTLGGTNKTNIGTLSESEKTANIQASFINAMKLFWNLYEINGSATADLFLESIITLNSSVTKAEQPVNHEPSDLVCETENLFEADDPKDGGDLNGDGFDDDTTTNARIRARIIPVRMYYGETTDESNFIGYGIAPNGGIESYAFANDNAFVFNSSTSIVTLFSLEAIEDTRTEVDFNPYIVDYDVVTLNGIPFVSKAEGNSTADATALTATGASTYGDMDTAASITSLDFYTYA